MIIDIFRNQEIIDNKNPYNESINSIEVYNYIIEKLDINLSNDNWLLIDNIFSNIWNEKIGIGGLFYWDEIENDVLTEFKKHKILTPDKDIILITHTILEYIEQKGGIIE